MLRTCLGCLGLALCVAACVVVLEVKPDDPATPPDGRVTPPDGGVSPPDGPVIRLDAAIIPHDGPDIPPDAPDTPPDPSVNIYRADWGSGVPPATYGGMPCTFRISFDVFTIELRARASSEFDIVGGRVVAHNIETLVPSPGCPPDTQVIPPNFATYTLESAAPDPNGVTVTLTFKGAPTNMPAVALTMVAMPVGGAYRSWVTLHRTDAAPPLDWTVMFAPVLSWQPPD